MIDRRKECVCVRERERGGGEERQREGRDRGNHITDNTGRK